MRKTLLAIVGVTLLLLPGAGYASPERNTNGDSPGIEAGSVLPAPLTAVYGPSANFAMSSDAHVKEGEVHHGELVALFGDVVIDGTVTGEVIVIMGSLRVNGTIESNVVSVLSETILTETARIEGELINLGWPLQRHEGSRITGELVNISFMNLVPFVDVDTESLLLALLKFFFLIKLALLAAGFVFTLITAALIPRRVAIIAEAMPRQWGWSILIGLLAWSLFFIASCIIAVTIIGLPLAGALGLAMWIVKWVGRTAIFFLVGQTIGRNVFRRELPHMSSILCGFLAYALLYMIPLVGGFVTLGLNIVGVGMVILTKFGAEEPWGRGHVVEPRPAPPAAGAATPPSESTPPAAT